MSDSNHEVEKIAAMVDFYSDRAEAHAGFFLASVFGLFSILTLAQGETITWRQLVWAIPYWLLFLGSLYALANFNLYAVYAQRVIEIIPNKKVDTTLTKAKENPFLKRFQLLKDFFTQTGSLTLLLISIIYLIIAFLSCILVMGWQAGCGIIAVLSVVGLGYVHLGRLQEGFYCRYCGTKNIMEANYCRKCGKKIGKEPS